MVFKSEDEDFLKTKQTKKDFLKTKLKEFFCQESCIAKNIKRSSLEEKKNDIGLKHSDPERKEEHQRGNSEGKIKSFILLIL